ncbi:hypothetical protein GQ53DRAFT_833691 [Thozetella sp. PMI_491]|nr:hypothetical protein GQ53DRAFT_833691 [Thozetella sp. PMI_491]
MKFQPIFISAFLLATLASAMVMVPENEESVEVKKRNAWTVYLHSDVFCQTPNEIGGYSQYGNRGCTPIEAYSVSGDMEGCRAIFYKDLRCLADSPVGHLDDANQSPRCFAWGIDPTVQERILAFTVDC